MTRALLRFAMALVVVTSLAALGSRVPEALARVDAFRVRTVDYVGGPFLSREEALAAASIPPDATVWDDFGPWEERLRSHPLVEEARLSRRLPDVLEIRVVERRPVALVPVSTLEPVDREGRILPLDPVRHELNLPLLDVRPPPQARGEAVRPSILRLRPLALEADRLARWEPEFATLLSEIRWDDGRDATAVWGHPAIRIHFRPPLTPARVRQAITVIAHATSQSPERRVRAVDLRYEDQVVVRYR